MASSSRYERESSKRLIHDSRQEASESFKELFRLMKSARFCDAAFTVAGRKFVAHRNVLWARSYYFRHLLLNLGDIAFTNIKQPRIFTGERRNLDAEAECFQMCIDFMYCAEVEVPADKEKDLLRYSLFLHISDLTDALERRYISRLNINTFYQIKKMAEEYDIPRVASACDKLAEEQFYALSQTDDYKRLAPEYIGHLLRSRRNNTSETDKLKAILRWLEDKSTRTGTTVVSRLVQYIDFRKVPSSYCVSLSTHKHFAQISHINSAIIERKAALLGDVSYMKPNAMTAFHCGLKELLLFHPSDNTWAKLHRLNRQIACVGEFRARHRTFSSTILGDRIYVLKADKSFFSLQYHSKNATWERLESANENRGLSELLNDGTRIYAVGNWPLQDKDVTTTSSIEQYIPSRNRWYMVSYGVIARFSSCVFLKGLIYCMGGENQGAPVNDVQSFDVFLNSWDEEPPMRQKRSLAGSVAYEGKIFVFGGKITDDHMNPSKRGECYDPVARVWTLLRPMITVKGICNPVVTDEWIFVFSNDEIPPIDCTSIEKYSVRDDSWEKVKAVQNREWPFRIFSPVGVFW